MDSNRNQPPYRLSLPVLPSTPAKVEQMKAEAEREAQQPAEAPAAERSRFEAEAPKASGVALAAHVNREPRANASAEDLALEEKIVDALRYVYDPEIPVNVYDLGLIYNIHIDAEKKVKIFMTLTAPGCPVAGDIVMQVEARVEGIPEVKQAVVDLVWDPPWSREMLSEAAKLELGL